MAGRILFQGVAMTTQEPQAVEALAAYLNKPVQDGVLDLGDVKLVRSNRGDAFYVVSATGCSCPSAFYNHGGPCKHQRKYFVQPKKSQAELDAESDAELSQMIGPKKLARAPDEPLFKRGGFRPCLPEEA